MDVRVLVVVPHDAYPANSGPHDYSRAVLTADPSSRRRRPAPRKQRPAHSLACLAAADVLGFELAHDVSVEAWRGLIVAPEHRCSPYELDDYPYPRSVERSVHRGRCAPR